MIDNSNVKIDVEDNSDPWSYYGNDRDYTITVNDQLTIIDNVQASSVNAQEMTQHLKFKDTKGGLTWLTIDIKDSPENVWEHQTVKWNGNVDKRVTSDSFSSEGPSGYKLE